MKKSIIFFVSMAVFALSVTAQTFSFQSINKNGAVQKAGNHPEIEQKARNLAATLKRQPVFGATNQSKSAKEVEAAVNFHAKRLQAAKAAAAQPAKPKMNVNVVKSAVPDAATITLNVVGDPFSDGTGFQMFFDPDCKLDWQKILSYPEFFEVCEYRMPTDATTEFATTPVVLDQTMSITLPQGKYNLIILNIYREWELAQAAYWADTYDVAVGDGFNFKNGYEYIFTIEYYSYVQYNPEYDIALTGLTLPEASFELTNEESISVHIANPCAFDFSSVDLSYQINGGDTITETLSAPLVAGSEEDYTFNAKADFSAGGIYTVKAWLTHDDDMKPMNNTLTATTKKIVPLALPFLTDFDTQNDLLYWTFVNQSGYTTYYYDLNNVDADGGLGNLQFNKTYFTKLGHAYFVSDPLNFTGTENNVRFQFQPYGEFTLRILCGTTPNPEEMTLVREYPNLNGYQWEFRATNFTVEEPGIYYIALEYYAEAGVDPDPLEYGEDGEKEGGGSMAIDNIIIDSGVFIGIPDLEVVKMVSPASACDMTEESVISVKVKNAGTEPISNITLSYQINDSEPVEEIIYFETEYWQAYQLGIGEEAIVRFATKANFSALDEYTIHFEGSVEDEKNDENNTFETTLVHYAPVTTLPFTSDFANPDDRKEWTSTEVDGWLPNPALGCLWPDKTQIPLLSRCLTLEAGKYRFDYGYSGGWQIPGLGIWLFDNFYVTYGKVGEDPLTWEPVKSYSDIITYGEVIGDNIILDITEPGEYVVAVVSTQLGDLAIWHTTISEVKTHDVRLTKIQSPENFPRILPKEQLAGVRNMAVTVANRGEEAETGSIVAAIDGTTVGSTTFSVEQNNSTTAPIEVTVPEYPAGNLNVTFTATITGQEDAIPGDNVFELAKVVSDSTFAHDSFNPQDGNFRGGFATNNPSVRVGLIYELFAQDTLTSVTLGFCTQASNPDFNLAVYPVVANLTIGEAFFSVRQPIIAGASSVFAVPQTILPAGRYFFEIKDFAENSFYVISDGEADGHFYARDNATLLAKIEGEGLGNIHLRPNFGVPQLQLSTKEIQTTDFRITIHPRPNVGDFTVVVPEAATVEIFNVTGTKIAVQPAVTSADFSLKQSGIYIVKAISRKNGTVISKKIIVK
ncbi:MAG: T9SS type A sorting domain-containing protein [Dysgonamonadaceae bacterium]|jgi:hypothetical protein|nr:T9SS type A sorting domain-containing protein [Dysgonamonadaceae bacterium]